MHLAIIFVVGTLGHLSTGTPLESPSTDFSQFFDQRIIGGNDAAKGSAPYMAALVIGITYEALICGASIIGKQLILTAAHCIIENWNGGLLDTFHARTGSNIWHDGNMVELESHANHPEYDHINIKNDVAVIITKFEIELSKKVAIIALDFERVLGGEECLVTGWGSQRVWGPVPDKLQYLYLNTISYEECAEFAKAASSPWWTPIVHEILEICTLHSPGFGLCHGDSGSALVKLSNNKQIGVVSWAMDFCANGWPDMHTSVHGTANFIQGYLQ